MNRWMPGLLLALAAALPAAADELTLRNGDKVTGKTVALSGGTLKFETAHSGVLSVAWGEVGSLVTEGPVRITLHSGEILSGRIVAGKEGHLRVESEGAGAGLEVPFDRVRFLNEPPIRWHGSVDLAGRSTDGNTNSESLLVTSEASRVTEQDRILFRAAFRYGESHNVITERNGYGLAKYDYLFTERVYGYASLELFSDRFQDLTLRTILSAGAGWVVEKSDARDFSVDGGFAYFVNDFRDADDDSHPGARAGLRFRQRLPLGLQFTDEGVIFPNFEDGDDWQARNEAAVATALAGGWALKGGVITEYDHDPADGRRKHDNIYFVGLSWRF